jgi:hypothetical protein
MNSPIKPPRKPELEYSLRRKRSPVPFLVTVGFLALYAVITAFSAWFHILIAGGGSILLYSITNRMFPPVEVKIPHRQALPPSGSSEADKLLGSGDDHLKNAEGSMTKIAAFNRRFADEIAPVLACGYKINSYVAENPDKRQNLRRYYNYYLPQLDKLLKAYLTFRRHGLDGRNASSAMTEIEDAVRAMYTAFASQLDKLLYDMTLDITTDIEVLESMLSETADGAPSGMDKKSSSQQ